MDVFVPAIPEMSRFFKIDNTTMQASLYLFMLTVAFGQLLIGPLSDRFGRRFMALCSAFLFFMGSLLASYSPTIPLFIIARIIQASGACGTYLMCFIIVRDNFSTQACARLFSILSGINSMVASSAPVIGGLLLDLTRDWHSGFYFLTFLGLLMTGVTFRYIPNYNYSKPDRSVLPFHQRIKHMLDNPDFRNHTLVAAASLLGLYLFCALSPSILMVQLHLSGTEYGFWFGLNAMTVFFANMVAARLTYTYPLEKIVLGGLMIMILSCLLMMVFNFHQCSILTFMLPMLCLTIGIGISMGTSTALALKDYEHQAAFGTALLGACQFGLAGLIGIVVAQWTPGALSLAIPVLSFSLLGFLKLAKVDMKLLDNS